ncbi:MAG: hypothetical protein P1U67_10990 [Alcanivoracaceae bacterium]|nr:hypothetical protein [Alcanivoracaceae bacterium]
MQYTEGLLHHCRYLGAVLRISLCLILSSLSAFAMAGAELGAGVWWVYQYTEVSDFTGPTSAFDADLDNQTGGNFADPAFILYANDDDSHGPWHFSGEMRLDTGSFTQTANNNSGDSLTMHKAWIARDLSEGGLLTVGKSQVPFGWKTENFWPGDLLEGGYGDQMDVGVKWTQDVSALHYAVGYFHQDDWGEISTDTVDDNGHWGTSNTYRKIKTGVVNVDYDFSTRHTFGVSYQNGRLQDLAGTVASQQRDVGTHNAVDLHYYFNYGNWRFKYRFIDAQRDYGGMDALLATCAASCPANTKVETQRQAAHLGYRKERWHFYLEGSTAISDTDGNSAERVEAYAPGVSYQYGPGWLYLEYLWQNGDIDRYGDVYEANFRTVYASFDFYF